MKMNKLFYLLPLSAFISCSSTSYLTAPEGVKRVKISQEDYHRPQFFMDKVQKDILLKPQLKQVAKRGPASVKKDVNLSNRELYFLNLYKQYKVMSKLAGVDDQMNSCPSFHNVLLEHKELVDTSSSNVSVNVNLNVVSDEPTYSKFYPMLALPSDKGDLYTKMNSTSWKDSKNEIVKSLKEYVAIEKKELTQLCDRGVSDGYYIFENLVTYFQQDKSFHASQEGLEAFSKVPVVANMMIIDNFNQGEEYVKSNDLRNLLFKRTNTFWFKNYISHLESNRKEILSRYELKLPKTKTKRDLALR